MNNLGKKLFKTLVSVSLISGFISTNLSAQVLEDGKNKVMYKSQGVKLSGDLYIPDNFDKSKKYPTMA